MKRYDIVYCDPPWDYKGQKQHNGKGGKDTGGAISHYSTMTSGALKRMNVLGLCNENCLLFMWATSPHLDQAIDVMKAWGFQWATVGFVWEKDKVNPGFYTMSQTELCLVGKRKGGKIPQPRGARNIRQLVCHPRMKHSKKPDEVRLRIEQMFPSQSKIELFARSPSIGWDAWGNEVLENEHLNSVLFG